MSIGSNQIESMESMALRLNDTGGGTQANAVIKAINGINGATGMLDANNRVTAIYHLAVALSGVSHAVGTIMAAAELLDEHTHVLQIGTPVTD